MPAITMFYGIIIYMYSENGVRHKEPHFHACYQEEEAVFSLDAHIIEGSICNSKRKLIEAWVELHKEELEANWKLLSEGQKFFKIEPLR